MSTAELIPLLQDLQHAEKLRLVAFLLGEIAREEGVSLDTDLYASNAQSINGAAHVDALSQLADMAQPLGASDLSRHFDQHVNKH